MLSKEVPYQLSHVPSLTVIFLVSISTSQKRKQKFNYLTEITEAEETDLAWSQ